MDPRDVALADVPFGPVGCPRSPIPRTGELVGIAHLFFRDFPRFRDDAGVHRARGNFPTEVFVVGAPEIRFGLSRRR